MNILRGTKEDPQVILLDRADVAVGIHVNYDPGQFDFFWEHRDGPVTLKRLRWTDDASYIEAQYGTGPSDECDEQDEAREVTVDPAEYRGNDYGDDEPDDDDLPF